MSTSALSAPWIPRWTNTAILLASVGLLGLTLAIHPLWNAAIAKAANDGLEVSQHWFTTAVNLANAITWGIGLAVAVGSVIAVREQLRTIVLIPLLLAIALLATPLLNSAHADSTWARSAVLERLIELRTQGQPSSDEPRLLMALTTRNQPDIEAAFHALPPARTQQLLALQAEMGMDTAALKAKGFAERSDVDAAVDFSRTYSSAKEIQRQLYGLLALTEPRKAQE